MTWNDDTMVEIMFTQKAGRKSTVALTHQKLPDKSAAERIKSWWDERLDVLGELLA